MICCRRQFALAVALGAALACGRALADEGGASPTAAATQAADPSTSSIENQSLTRTAGTGKEGQRLGNGESKPPSGGGWLESLGALAAVLGLILGLRWLLKRYGGRGGVGGSARVMEVLARTPVTARQQMVLVRVGKRLLVVGAGAEGLSSLASIEDPQEISDLLGAVEQAKAHSLTNSFTQVLRGRRDEMTIRDEPGVEPVAEQDGRSPVGGAVSQVRSLLARVREMTSPGGRRP